MPVGAKETLLERFVTEYVFRGDRAALNRIDAAVDKTKQRLDSLAKPFAIIGAGGAAALGLVAKAGLTSEQALLRTQAALGFTDEQMKGLRDDALRVGSFLTLNTADIINAQQAYGKLGAIYAEIRTDIEAISGAAVATDLPVQEVAAYARVIQNVFGGDVTENLDMMLRVANRSPATFRGLGEAIQYSGAAAVAVGLDFKTWLATLAGTAEAGRSVESVSQGLTDVLGKVASFQEEIGRGAKLIENAFSGLDFDIEQVKKTMDGTPEGFLKFIDLINAAELSGSELLALARALFGSTYAASFISVIENPDTIRELIAEAEGASGDVAKQVELIMSGASGGVAEVIAMVDTLLNRLSELGTLDAIEKFTGRLVALLGWLTATNEEGDLTNEWLLRAVQYGLAFAGSLLVVALGLKVVSFSLGPMAWGLKLILVLYGFLTSGNVILTAQLYGLAIAQRAVALWSGIVAGATAIWTGAQWLLNAALTANPIGLVIVGIALLIAAVAAAIIYWDEWTAKIREMPTWIKGLLIVMFGWIAALALLAAYWDNVSAAIGRAIDWMRRIPGGRFIFGEGGGEGSGPPAGPPPPPDSPLPSGLDGGLPGFNLAGLSAAGLGGIAAPLPVGPAPSASPGATTNSQELISRVLNIGSLNVAVNAPGADSEEIGRNVGESLEAEFRKIVELSDSQVAR